MRHPVVGVGVEHARRAAGAGRIASPSAVSVDVARRAPLSSVASAASRSVSWPRMCAMPRRCDGPSASAHSAATTGVSSPTSCRSASSPCERAGAGDGQPVVVERRPCAPIRASRSRSASPAWVVAAASRGTVTAPAGDQRPAARNGAALDRSGSISVVDGARSGPGATRQRFGLGVVDLDAVLAQHRDGHLDVRQRRHRLAVVAHVDALVEARRRPAAAPETNWLERRRVDGRPCPPRHARRRPRTVNGSAPRPSSSTATPSVAQRRAAPRRSAGCARAGRRRRRPAPSASAATGGTNRITVPARPQSTVGAAGRTAPGVTIQSSPAVSTRGAERGQAAGHQLGVARAQRPAYDGGAVGERGEHQRAVGQRLEPGSGHVGVAPGPCATRGAARGRAGHRRSVAERARRPASAQVGLGDAWPRAWPARRRCLASRRTSRPARRARQATPGLALGVDGGDSRPPSIETFLKKCTAAAPAGSPCPSPPRSGGRPASSAPARRRARRRRAAAPGRWRAPAAATIWAAALIRTSVTGSVGTGSCGTALLDERHDLVGDRLGCLRQGRGVPQGVDAADRRTSRRASDGRSVGWRSWLLPTRWRRRVGPASDRVARATRARLSTAFASTASRGAGRTAAGPSGRSGSAAEHEGSTDGRRRCRSAGRWRAHRVAGRSGRRGSAPARRAVPTMPQASRARPPGRPATPTTTRTARVAPTCVAAAVPETVRSTRRRPRPGPVRAGRGGRARAAGRPARGPVGRPGSPGSADGPGRARRAVAVSGTSAGRRRRSARASVGPVGRARPAGPVSTAGGPPGEGPRTGRWSATGGAPTHARALRRRGCPARVARPPRRAGLDAPGWPSTSGRRTGRRRARRRGSGRAGRRTVPPATTAPAVTPTAALAGRAPRRGRARGPAGARAREQAAAPPTPPAAPTYAAAAPPSRSGASRPPRPELTSVSSR